LTFKLNIECSKDVSELHITFSDGTNISTQPLKESVLEEGSGTQSNNFLDTEADFGSVSSEIVHPPEIVREKKEVLVAEEMQNLDF